MSLPSNLPHGFSGTTEMTIITTTAKDNVETRSTQRRWYSNGLLHRDDGPAVVGDDGLREWWINGGKLTEEEFEHLLEKKALNEKLQFTLPPKPTTKRGKI